MDQPAEIVELGGAAMNPEVIKAGEKSVDYFQQYGPWCVLAVILIALVSFASWKIYTRMANALDNMHAQTVAMAERHAEAMKEVTDKYQKSMTEVTDKHTGVCTGFMNAIGDLGRRVGSLEDLVRK